MAEEIGDGRLMTIMKLQDAVGRLTAGGAVLIRAGRILLLQDTQADGF